MKMPPNEITAPNAGITLSFQSEHPWPGVGEFNCYAAGSARLIKRLKRRLVEPAAARSEAPGRHAARHVTAPVSRATPGG
jgi:hypothetical protein